MMRQFTILILFGITISAYARVAEKIPADTPPVKSAHPLPYKNKTITRGQLLYENHCLVCHDSMVHIRNKRKAASIGAINSWVTRWSIELKLNWSADDINDVAAYLNQRYYQFTE